MLSTSELKIDLLANRTTLGQQPICIVVRNCKVRQSNLDQFCVRVNASSRHRLFYQRFRHSAPNNLRSGSSQETRLLRDCEGILKPSVCVRAAPRQFIALSQSNSLRPLFSYHHCQTLSL